MNILGFGLSGLVGARVTSLLSPHYTFELYSRANGVDVTNAAKVNEILAQSSAPIVIHAAAATNVDLCESEKALGENSSSWKLTVGSTETIAQACQKYHKKLIYISTDFVFSGQQELYGEDDIPEPINWYGSLKYEAEKIVQKDSKNGILRISYPYGSGGKTDFVQILRDRFKTAQPIQAVTDHYFTPTYLDDIAVGLRVCIDHDQSGVVHVVGDSFVTPFGAADAIAETFGYNKELIVPTTRDVFFAERAKRPYKLQLTHAKITSLGVRPRNFLEGLVALKQLER